MCEIFAEAISIQELVGVKRAVNMLKLNFPDDQYWKDECLLNCVYFNCSYYIKDLIELGANPDSNSLLEIACENENMDIIRALVEGHADVNLKSSNNNQPLRIAYEKNNTAIIDYLVEHGAVEVDFTKPLIPDETDDIPF